MQAPDSPRRVRPRLHPGVWASLLLLIGTPLLSLIKKKKKKIDLKGQATFTCASALRTRTPPGSAPITHRQADALKPLMHITPLGSCAFSTQYHAKKSPRNDIPPLTCTLSCPYLSAPHTCPSHLLPHTHSSTLLHTPPPSTLCSNPKMWPRNLVKDFEKAHFAHPSSSPSEAF